MFKGIGQSDLLMKFKIISLYNMIAVSVWLPRKQTDSLKQNIVNVNVNMCKSFRALNKHHSNKKGSLINLDCLDGLIFSIFHTSLGNNVVLLSRDKL